ncbi:MAG TPA: DUF1543 domain-containing protein [Bacteroidia bacterium]|jgi:hypothetical protein
MSDPKLYMILLGCRPKGRFTEQHDIFFGIADTLKNLVPYIKNSWPEAKGNIHIDAWKEVSTLNGYRVLVTEKEPNKKEDSSLKLFFINLGGYRKDEFDEFHYKMIIPAADAAGAVKIAKATAFYKKSGFKGAASHIDDKFGLDVDDVYEVPDILPEEFRSKYKISIITDPAAEEDEIHLGYLQLWKIKD